MIYFIIVYLNNTTLTEEDKELIGYCDIHSKTPRALFHVNNVNKLCKLIGPPHMIQNILQPPHSWLSTTTK